MLGTPRSQINRNRMSYSSRMGLAPAPELPVALFLVAPEPLLLLVDPLLILIAAARLIGLRPAGLAALPGGLLLGSMLLCPLRLHGVLLRRLAAASLKGGAKAVPVDGSAPFLSDRPEPRRSGRDFLQTARRARAPDM